MSGLNVTKRNSVRGESDAPQSPAPVTLAHTESHCEPTYTSINPNFQPLATPCPHCNQVSLESAFQPPLVPTKTGYMMTHCTNTDCAAYALTLEHTAFMKAKAQEGGSDE